MENYLGTQFIGKQLEFLKFNIPKFLSPLVQGFVVKDISMLNLAQLIENYDWLFL